MATTLTFPHQPSPRLAVLTLEFQLRPCHLPVAAMNAFLRPPGLMHYLANAVTRVPRQHLVEAS